MQMRFRLFSSSFFSSWFQILSQCCHIRRSRAFANDAENEITDSSMMAPAAERENWNVFRGKITEQMPPRRLLNGDVGSVTVKGSILREWWQLVGQRIMDFSEGFFFRFVHCGCFFYLLYIMEKQFSAVAKTTRVCCGTWNWLFVCVFWDLGSTGGLYWWNRFQSAIQLKCCGLIERDCFENKLSCCRLKFQS